MRPKAERRRRVPPEAISRRFAVLALVSFVAGCGWLQSFAKKNQPKVLFKGVTVEGVDFQQARLVAEVLVMNQIPVDLTVARVDWAVKIDAAQLVAGQVSSPVSVPASGKTPVKIPFVLKFEDVYRIAEKYKEADEAPYQLSGTLHIDTPAGPVPVPFTHRGVTPVLKVPQIDLAKVEVRGVSFSGADVRIGFHVKNPNKPAIQVQSLDYAVTIAGARVADGKLPSPLEVAGKGTGAFDADVKVSFSQAQAAFDAFRKGSNTEYSVAGNLAAKTPWGEVTTPYSKSGTIKIQK